MFRCTYWPTLELLSVMLLGCDVHPCLLDTELVVGVVGILVLGDVPILVVIYDIL